MRCGGNTLRTGFRKFLNRSVAPGNTDRADIIGNGADQIMFAIADHCSPGNIRIFVDGKSQQLRFVGSGAVEFAAENAFEVLSHVEMFDDPFGSDARFTGRDV